MKKLLSGLLMAAFMLTAVTLPTKESKAQMVDLVTKSITAADTIVYKNVGSKLKSISYGYTETSGTTAGKVYWEGSNITGNWDLLDSLTLSDVTTLQKKTVVFTATNYASYRLRNTNTSSAVGAVNAAMIRRPDE